MDVGPPDQTIDIVYDDRRHWFNVQRYSTSQELLTALLKDGIEVHKHTVAHTVSYPEGEECGRMYLLDTSIATYAREATHMALGILARHSLLQSIIIDSQTPDERQPLASIVGLITSQLYSRNKYY